ncbi:MAG: hypothetical protein KHX42_05600 [Prevotella sp.]|nr:hypothetical protein [Prevotella sp.]
MKKLFTLLMLMVCAVGMYGQDIIWKMNEWTGEQNLTATQVKDGLTYHGTSSWESSSYTFSDGNVFAGCLKLGGKSTFTTKKDLNRVFSFTVDKESVIKVYTRSGSSSGTRTAFLSQEITTTDRDPAKVIASCAMTNGAAGILEGNVSAGNVYIYSDNNIKIYAITVTTKRDLISEAITGVTINETPVSIEDLTTLIEKKNLILDQAIYQTAPTVIFTNTKTYSDNSSKTENITAEMTEDADFFIATAVIGGDTYTIKVGRDKSVKSNDATLKSLNVNNEPINGFNAETLTYDVELPVGTTEIPTVAAEASSTVAKVDITQATELPGTATVVVTAEDGVTTSTYTINFTVSKGSSEKELTKAMFSNGFDGFIKDNIVEAYYMEGTEVPTLNATVSDKATYSVSGDVLTVTAEDGTTAEYTIKLEPVAPYTGLGRVFDGTESGWIKTGYSFDAATGADSKGWKFSKNVDEVGNKRITDGRNRLYFFVDACNSITLKTAQGIKSDRNIAVYVNNVKNSSITKALKYNANGTAGITIQCDKNMPCMVAVVSNQTGGDGGFGEIVVDKDAPASITLNSYGYNTYSNANTVTVTGAVAYTCTVNNETKKVVLKELGTVVPAGQGVLLKGEANGTVSFAFGGEEPVIAQNDFQPVLKAVATPADKAIYVLYGNQFKKYTGATLVANKAYIELGAGTAAAALSIEWDGGTTGIGGIEESVVDDNVPVYNLNGQRVDMNTKGIIIKNGKKIINK